MTTLDPLKQVPLPLFDVPSSLHEPRSGRHNLSESQEKDYHVAAEFLKAYQGSLDTFSAYRREVERLLQWSWEVAAKTLRELHRADLERFVEFCQKPPITWIGTRQAPRFIEDTQTGKRVPNSAWRPFIARPGKVAGRQGQSADPKRYAPSQKATQALFSITGSFFNYLIQEGYLEANPIAQIRQKSRWIRRNQTRAIVRRLSPTQWAYVIETAERLANADPIRHERTLFIMHALYAMYLRISELVSTRRWLPQMGHFHQDHEGCWWFKTVGKGNKERIIAVSNEMLEALKRYRTSLNFPPLPHLGENTPLLPKLRGAGPIESTRQIRSIVQDCFDLAIERLHAEGLAHESEQLKAATVHWLRHTGISDDVKIRPREHVRDDAGHGTSATTDRYIDVHLQERHASGRHKTIRPNYLPAGEPEFLPQHPADYSLEPADYSPKLDSGGEKSS